MAYWVAVAIVNRFGWLRGRHTECPDGVAIGAGQLPAAHAEFGARRRPGRAQSDRASSVTGLSPGSVVFAARRVRRTLSRSMFATVNYANEPCRQTSTLS